MILKYLNPMSKNKVSIWDFIYIRFYDKINIIIYVINKKENSTKNNKKIQIPETVLEEIPELNSYDRNYLEWNHNNWTDLFFKLIFKFIIILTKKSCYKSALEYCKLLLKLNPEKDPLGSLILIDYLSLASKQYYYLEEFVLTFGHRYYNCFENSLLLYPNFTFSYALAKFSLINEKISMKEELWKKVNEDDLEDIKTMNIDFRNASADKILLLALILYPQLFKEILICNEQFKHDYTESGFSTFQRKSWKELLEHEEVFSQERVYKYSFLKMDSPSDEDAL